MHLVGSASRALLAKPLETSTTCASIRTRTPAPSASDPIGSTHCVMDVAHRTTTPAVDVSEPTTSTAARPS